MVTGDRLQGTVYRHGFWVQDMDGTVYRQQVMVTIAVTVIENGV